MTNLPSNNNQQNVGANQTQNQLSPINYNEFLPSPANSLTPLPDEMLDIPPNPATLLPSHMDMVNFYHYTENGFLPNYNEELPLPPEFYSEILPYQMQSLLPDLNPPMLPNETVNIMQVPPPILPIVNFGMANVNEGSSSKEQARPRPSGHRGRPKQSRTMGITLQVPNGVDLVDWVVKYARSQNVSIVVLGGYGLVSVAHLITHDITNYRPVLNLLPEEMSIIDISGSYMLKPLTQLQPAGHFTATLCRLNLDVIGGRVTTIVPKGPVVLNVLLFDDYELNH